MTNEDERPAKMTVTQSLTLTATQIDARRAEVARLYLSRVTQTEIGKRLGISQKTVSFDLRAVRKQWRDSAVEIIDAEKIEMVYSLKNLEREYWQAWERSKQPHETQFMKNKRRAGAGADSGGDVEVSQRTEGQVGEPAFLDGVLKCRMALARVLGLEAPTKSELDVSLGINIERFFKSDTLSESNKEMREWFEREGKPIQPAAVTGYLTGPESNGNGSYLNGDSEPEGDDNE